MRYCKQCNTYHETLTCASCRYINNMETYLDSIEKLEYYEKPSYKIILAMKNKVSFYKMLCAASVSTKLDKYAIYRLNNKHKIKLRNARYYATKKGLL